MNDDRSKRVLDALTLKVIERIRASCGELSEAELLSLATDIAALELKYLGRASTTLGDRNTPDTKP